MKVSSVATLVDGKRKDDELGVLMTFLFTGDIVVETSNNWTLGYLNLNLHSPSVRCELSRLASLMCSYMS